MFGTYQDEFIQSIKVFGIDVGYNTGNRGYKTAVTTTENDTTPKVLRHI